MHVVRRAVQTLGDARRSRASRCAVTRNDDHRSNAPAGRVAHAAVRRLPARLRRRAELTCSRRPPDRSRWSTAPDPDLTRAGGVLLPRHIPSLDRLQLRCRRCRSRDAHPALGHWEVETACRRGRRTRPRLAPSWLTTSRRIGLLVTVVAAAAATSTWPSSATCRVPRRSAHAAGLVWVAAFAAGELLVVHIQLQRDSHSFSLTDLVLVAGLYLVSPAELITAQLAGAGLALVLHRRQFGLKLAFNLAQYALSGCLATILFAALSRDATLSGAWNWVGRAPGRRRRQHGHRRAVHLRRDQPVAGLPGAAGAAADARPVDAVRARRWPRSACSPPRSPCRTRRR